MYAEGESGDSNPVIALLSNSLSRDSSMMTTPHSSFPPSPQKSVVTMTIKEEDKIDDEEPQTNQRVVQGSDENLVDKLVKENSPIKEDTYSTHTTSSSSSVELTDPTSKVHELRDTFTVVQDDGVTEEKHHHMGDHHDEEAYHENKSQGNSHEVSEGNPHSDSQHSQLKDTTTIQDVNGTKENPQDTPSGNVSQPHSHCNSLESLHSILTTSDDSPVAMPISSHSSKFQQSAKQRRSFFPPIMDISEDKSANDSLQNKDIEVAKSSSKELATQLLSALEKELSNPLLMPTTCT